jgi:hypothetical protein
MINKLIIFSLFISFAFVACSNNNSKQTRSENKVIIETLDTVKKYGDSINYCHCDFSDEKKEKFFLFRDSIAQNLLKKSDSIIVIGLHGAGVKSGIEQLLFIGNTRTDDFLIYHSYDSLAKTPFYNIKMKSHLWQGILLNLNSLKATYNMKANGEVYDGVVFTITFITNTEKIDACICEAQLISNKNKPLTDLITFFKKKVLNLADIPFSQ